MYDGRLERIKMMGTEHGSDAPGYYDPPFVVLRHYPDGRTEWRDDQGQTGLFRPGVGLRAYPPYRLRECCGENCASCVLLQTDRL